MGRGLVIAILVLAATAMGAVMRPTAASSNREDKMRDQIGQFLNIERTNRGLHPLPIDADLAASAQAWSEHNRDTSCETSCHSTHAEGEIIAWGDVNSRSGTLMVAWMKSGNHRNIVLYPDATAMGVGVACKSGGEVYATVQFYDVYRPVAPTDQDPIATSEEWGSPCEGLEGQVPSTSTSTPTTHRTATTTTTRPRPTTTTAPPGHSAPPTTAAARPKPVAATPTAAPTTVVATTLAPSITPPPPTTTTTSPRVALRADGAGVTADAAPTTPDDATLFAEAAATPANAEPAWIAIVVVVLLLSGMRIGAQLQEVRAARRLEESEFRAGR